MWLLDVNVPKQLAEVLRGYGVEVETADTRGWAGLVNGSLVEASVAAGFVCVLTRDRLFSESASRALKRFLYDRVYATDALGGDRRLSMARISELFRFFLASPERLPQPYAQLALHTPAHRVVCDYIAGMTDAFFHRTYELVLCPA